MFGHGRTGAGWVAIVKLVEPLMGGGFGVLAVNVIVNDIFGRAGEAEKDAMVAVGVVLGRAMSGLFYGNGTAKRSDVAEVGNFTCPSLVGCFSDR
jgi:hypothetical protein